MIRLPILDTLDVDGYGLFPGTSTKPGLHITMNPGLTLVLGANGLGKSTLVTLIYRMLTGPYEIPGLVTAGSLGSMRLDATRLQRWDQRVLAARVVDEAQNASATLQFVLGSSQVRVTRSLATLTVTQLECDGDELQATDDRFQELVVEHSLLPAFGDWIVLLRYLTFYFEDRRALVWDPSAQRQILRLLMLPRATSALWASKEREVLELDSRVRNLQATLNREEGVERRAKTKAKDGQALVAEIGALEAELHDLVPLMEASSEALPAADAERQRARLRMLTTEQEREAAYRDLERLQLSRIADAFPDGADTARYLISRLLSTDVCQTCGSSVPDFAAELEQRLAGSHCVVCSSDLPERAGRRPVERKIAARTKDLDPLETALESARTVGERAEATFDALVEEFRRAEHDVAVRRAKVAGLVRRLPADERERRSQSDEVTSLRSRLERLRSDLDRLRGEFETQVKRDMLTIAEQRTKVIDAFQTFAEGFLFESCNLNWAPHKDRVGQTGPTVDYPSFEFEMSGSDFPTAVRRSGPEQVSESQREFIDLAFRMTLMSVASEGGCGSLVIDAPESSLDAVFSERAAKVLANFASPSTKNRLLVTSNLVDGQLIPKMLSEAGISSARSKRVVDLLELAVPTTATRELAADYRRVRDRLFTTSKSNS